MRTYTVVDLFSGAGGLSIGFDRTGRYKIVAAVEKDPNARATYLQNNRGVEMYEDVVSMDYQGLIAKYGEIDVVIGGPPCQGFSNANRQRNDLVNQNNQLVKEYVRAIKALHPRAFVLENVKMLKSSSHRFYYTNDDAAANLLEKYSIPSDYTYISLPPLCGTGSIWSESTFRVLSILQRYTRNPEKFRKKLVKCSNEIFKACDEIGWNDLRKEFERMGCISSESSDQLNLFITAQRGTRQMQELRDKNVRFEVIVENGLKIKVKSYSVYDYICGILGSEYRIVSGVLNAAEFGVPQKRQRFIMIGIRGSDAFTLPKGSFEPAMFRTVRDAIGNLETIAVHYDVADSPVPISEIRHQNPLEAELCNCPVIHNHVTAQTREPALLRFAALKEGQNFHDLDESLKNTYTDTTNTQNTVYKRLKYDEPSDTVVNVRKSMWIHPVIDRAISIREAARLQTFQDSYVFIGSKDAQYQQIGNAVPPLLSRAIAEKLASLLDACQTPQAGGI